MGAYTRGLYLEHKASRPGAHLDQGLLALLGLELEGLELGLKVDYMCDLMCHIKSW